MPRRADPPSRASGSRHRQRDGTTSRNDQTNDSRTAGGNASSASVATTSQDQPSPYGPNSELPRGNFTRSARNLESYYDGKDLTQPDWTGNEYEQTQQAYPEESFPEDTANQQTFTGPQLQQMREDAAASLAQWQYVLATTSAEETENIAAINEKIDECSRSVTYLNSLGRSGNTGNSRRR
ncbi:hypothetical protein L204_105141 [Cryptococcus depauperatus]